MISHYGPTGMTGPEIISQSPFPIAVDTETLKPRPSRDRLVLASDVVKLIIWILRDIKTRGGHE